MKHPIHKFKTSIKLWLILYTNPLRLDRLFFRVISIISIFSKRTNLLAVGKLALTKSKNINSRHPALDAGSAGDLK
jgi:hypothetical protein